MTTRLLSLASILLTLSCTSDPPRDKFDPPDDVPTAAPVATGSAKPKSAGENTPPSVTQVRVTTLGGALDNAHPAKEDTLEARATATDADGDGVLISWTWQVNGREVPGAVADRLLPQQGNYKKGDSVTALASARDTRGAVSKDPATGSVIIRNTPPVITSTPASLARYQIAATDADGDVLKFYLERAIPGFVLTSEGLLSFDSAAGKAAEGQTLVIVAHDAENATARQTIQVKF